MFKLIEEAEGSGKADNALKIKSLLEELPSKINDIIGYEVGINIIQSDRAMDMVIVSSFEDKDGLMRYINHPEHLKAVDFVNKRRSESRVVDFEI